MTAAAASDFDKAGFSSQNAYIIASDTSITVLAAVFEPAKADSVSLLQMGHRGSQLLHHSYNLHKSAGTGCVGLSEGCAVHLQAYLVSGDHGVGAGAPLRSHNVNIRMAKSVVCDPNLCKQPSR